MIKKANWTNLTSTDTVVVYPTLGHLAEDGEAWRIEICGTVFEEGTVSRRKELLLKFLQRVVKVRPQPAERLLFNRRVGPFIANTERGKRVVLRVGDKHYRLKKKTRRNGRFMATVRLPMREVEVLERDGHLDNGWVPLRIVQLDGTEEPLAGQVRLLSHSGVSVISDIDDTMKVTEVHSRRSLITNTFLREFRPIAGMAEHYRGWEREGVDFHYVSSSPWPLFGALSDHFEAADYPRGTFHLRSFKFREHMMRALLILRRRGKFRVIRSILERFPERKFVLVGDSGEKDPEIYGAIARRFPAQVQAIFIRNLPERPLNQERWEKAFRSLDADTWKLFSTPSELPASLTRGI